MSTMMTMAIKLPDAAVASIVGRLEPTDWGRLMCVDRNMQEQLLRVLVTTPVLLSVDCSIRSWKSLLQAAGSWCGCITRLSLLQGSARSMSSLQLLQPLLQSTLTHLTLQGFKLDHETCHARQLVDMLLQHCPKLESLDLQDCDLPHLGIFQRLLTASSHPANRPGHLHSAATERRGLTVLQLTGARLAPGPSTHSYDSTPGAASARTAGNQSLSQSLPTAQCDQRQHGSRGAGHDLKRADAKGMQELQLGCHYDQVDTAWLHLNSAVTSSHIIDLLQDRTQALRVLDVSKRPAVHDALLLHLAAHPPACLHTLDVSLTHVTPEGLVQLLRHCPKLRILKYACRAGGEGLSTQSMQRLAAVLPAVQELDFSLHPQLDASCLAALGQCKTLRKVKFARSHKITRDSLESLVASLPVLRELVVVRCRGVGQACLAGLAGRDSGLLVHT